MKLSIAADHAGVEYKKELSIFLKEKRISFMDWGTHDKTPTDYPLYTALVCESLSKGDTTLGILICGSGIGMSIAANRYSHIRAALCSSGLEARLARQHNNANVLCLGARIIGISQAFECVERFIETEFEGGRHQRRLEMLNSL